MARKSNAGNLLGRLAILIIVGGSVILGTGIIIRDRMKAEHDAKAYQQCLKDDCPKQK